MADGFNIDASSVMSNMDLIASKVLSAGKMYGETAGLKMISDAKQSAKWTDRTALSRQTMSNTTLQSGSSTEIVLSGNTDQFKYLELAMEKKYAILMPTINKWQGQVLTGWANAINKVR